ncbi:hypothetical protein DL96DRAFT_1580925 [Flagelloscypha sp. PMI_526]|nr:hypothetical protein DL96DRAFT_1580925 [Flagelloscypha sp. PMI_526]
MAVTFPFDLYTNILTSLSPTDLKACSLVSRVFRNITQPILFSHKTFGAKSSYTPVDFEKSVFLGNPRGRELSQQAKAVTLLILLFRDNEAAILVEFLLNCPALSSLSFINVHPDIGLHPQVLNGIARSVLPSLLHLCIDTASETLPFGNILNECKALQHLEIKNSYIRQSSRGKFTGTLPALNHLTLEDCNFGHSSGQSFLSDWIIDTKGTLQHLSIGYRDVSDDVVGICQFLHGFTSLEELHWGIGCYKYIIYHVAALAQLSIIPPNLPLLHQMSFEIPTPRLEGWANFFSWISRLISENSSPLKQICFESGHPAMSRPDVSRPKNGLDSQTSFAYFNTLASTSKVRLKFNFRPLAPESTEAFQRRGFEVVANVVKRWMASWYELGKLEICRG